jgi:secreted trypsin-like serine protease
VHVTHRSADNVRVRLSVRILYVAAVLAFVAPATAEGDSPRIVGGAPAPAGSWPWAAYISDAVAGGTASCTGTVVAPNVVLTAAHCVTDLSTRQLEPVQGFHVVTGALDWTSPSAQVSSVTQIVEPSNFTIYTLSDGSTYSDHDIALIELATPTTEPAIPFAADPAATRRCRATSPESTPMRAGFRAG